MNIKQTDNLQNMELPMDFALSFGKIYSFYKKYASKKHETHSLHKSSKMMVEEFKKHPELIEGFSDFSLLEKYSKQIDLILNPIFPDVLALNEIKAATLPFSFTPFKVTSRLKNILDNAGEDYKLSPRNFDDNMFYIMACTMILMMTYDYHLNLQRPFFFDIPDKNGNIKNYRVAVNADMGEIIRKDSTPKITEDDIKLLLDNFDNIDIWKEKFPPNSYIFKGFGIFNMFDVTADEAISDIKDDLLQDPESLTQKLQRDIRRFYNINDLKVGFSVYNKSKDSLDISGIPNSESLMVRDEINSCCSNFFCNDIFEKVLSENKPLAISDVEKYGKLNLENPLYQTFKSKGIGSIIIIPFNAKDAPDLYILEISSPRPFELNSINQHKLKDIIPVFEAHIERATKEHQNRIEATIQKFYTSIHPSVKWRFYDAADKYDKAKFIADGNIKDIKLDEIVFNDVYPLYAQSDIKGSSIARNEAVKEDLTTQLNLAINVLKEAKKHETLLIYDELIFQINENLENLKVGIKAGDEISILDFLKREIYPVFDHIKDKNNKLFGLIELYKERLDDDLHVVYEKRKNYTNSVKLLNDKLANYLEKKQQEAQVMFPHYFEQYKTDGVEFNMYIGQSLVRDKKFEKLYLHNLRLWQLQVIYEMEKLAYSLRDELEYKLQIASLILVYNSPLQIKFRMGEKRFDVEGAYNIRYEIIKKRIDKAYIKGSNDRLTVPGKIAIVYSQEKDALEYMKYIKYLQSKKFLGEVERLELEDLHGVTGLKALRV